MFMHITKRVVKNYPLTDTSGMFCKKRYRCILPEAFTF
jgi:hypothetical protein